MNTIIPSNGMQQIEIMRARINLEHEILEFEKGYFEVLQASGLLPKHITKWQQFSAITSYGRMLGIEDVWTALRHIPVVNGNPGPDVQLMLALIEQSGLLRDIQIEDDGKIATCMMIRSGGQTVTCTFSQEQAERITTISWKDGKQITVRLVDKENWRNYPDVMRKWRAAGQAARLLFPDVINGLVKMPPGSYVVVSEDPDALMASPASKRAMTAVAQLGNGNGGKERRLSDPMPEPTSVAEAEIVQETLGKTDSLSIPNVSASPFALSANVARALIVGPAHPSEPETISREDTLDIPTDAARRPTAEDLRQKLVDVPDDPAIVAPAPNGEGEMGHSGNGSTEIETTDDPKGYKLDTRALRTDFRSWCHTDLGLKVADIATAFDVSAVDLDKALATVRRSDAEEIMRVYKSRQPTL